MLVAIITLLHSYSLYTMEYYIIHFTDIKEYDVDKRPRSYVNKCPAWVIVLTKSQNALRFTVL